MGAITKTEVFSRTCHHQRTRRTNTRYPHSRQFSSCLSLLRRDLQGEAWPHSCVVRQAWRQCRKSVSCVL